MKVAGILLAAGSSRRFGGNKLHHLIKNRPMLLYSAETLIQSLTHFVCVINPADLQSLELLQEKNIPYILCENANNGMSESIKCGISHFFDADAWIIALADMPFLKKQTVKYIVNTVREGKELVAPLYNGQRGHPVGISKNYWLDLQNLSGDVGAREILNKNKDSLSLINVRDEGVTIDIDHPHLANV